MLQWTLLSSPSASLGLKKILESVSILEWWIPMLECVVTPNLRFTTLLPCYFLVHNDTIFNPLSRITYVHISKLFWYYPQMKNHPIRLQDRVLQPFSKVFQNFIHPQISSACPCDILNQKNMKKKSDFRSIKCYKWNSKQLEGSQLFFFFHFNLRISYPIITIYLRCTP